MAFGVNWKHKCRRGDATYDKVYVAKGGTLNDLLVNFTGTKVQGGTPTTDANGFTIHGLACPASYFMAILAQKGNEFHAIAFLVPHQEGLARNPKAEDLQRYVVSVDELERKTGIDFFCNLDDAVENQVEAEAVIFLFLLVVAGNAQNKKGKLYGVAFYNLENLFDTVHDEGKNDYEYLPDGRNKWDDKKYQSKLEHMSTVLSLLATDKVPQGAAVIGMAEVENRRVLEDLLAQPALKERGYPGHRLCHVL